MRRFPKRTRLPNQSLRKAYKRSIFNCKMAPVGAYIEEIEARILGQEQMMVRFCQGCDYSNSHEACPYPIKAKAVIHDECDWSMMQGVGTPRTDSTFKIWDPHKEEM